MEEGKEMRLSDFYKDLFEEAFCKFEPVWEADAPSPAEYRWSKANYPFREQFQIVHSEDGHPVLLFSFLLPEPYLDSTIFEEVKSYESSYGLSLIVMERTLRLVAKQPAENMRESILGFIHQARSEVMDILDRVAKRARGQRSRPSAPCS